MKKWAIASGLLFCCAFGWAQRFVGGSLSLAAYSRGDRHGSDYLDHGVFISIAPTFGRSRPRSEWGVSFLAEYQRNVERHRDGFGVLYKDATQGIVLGLQPFYRKKWPLFEKCQFFAETNLPLLIAGGGREYAYVFPSDYIEEEASIGLGLRGGFFYQISPRWRAEAQAAFFQLKFSTESNNNGEENVWRFQSQVNTTGWLRFGLSYFFVKTAKSADK